MRTFPATVTLCLALLMLASTCGGQTNDAAPPPTQDEVLVGADSPMEAPEAPISLLVAALKAHATAWHFHVTWSFNAFNFFSEETAIYDRKAGDLALFSSDNNLERQHIVFTGVKEAMFPKILKRHHGEYFGNGWGYFDDLAKYGCRKYDLTAMHKTQHHFGRRRRASMATSSRRTLAAKRVTAS